MSNCFLIALKDGKGYDENTGLVAPWMRQPDEFMDYTSPAMEVDGNMYSMPVSGHLTNPPIYNISNSQLPYPISNYDPTLYNPNSMLMSGGIDNIHGYSNYMNSIQITNSNNNAISNLTDMNHALSGMNHGDNSMQVFSSLFPTGDCKL